MFCCCHSDVCPEVCCEEPLNAFGELQAATTDPVLAATIDVRIKACNSRGNRGDDAEPDYVAKCGTDTAT